MVPMTPDYFSVIAIDSLSSVLPKWKEWATKAKATKILQEATYPLPNCTPKFLGTIVQKYRLRSQGTPSTAFQKWIDEVQDKVAKKLVPVLTAAGMMLPSDTYKLAGMKVGEPLLQMSDFNGLIAQSQKHNAPVFALTDAQLEQTGIVLARTKKSMKEFAKLFGEAADRVITLINA